MRHRIAIATVVACLLFVSAPAVLLAQSGDAAVADPETDVWADQSMDSGTVYQDLSQEEMSAINQLPPDEHYRARILEVSPVRSVEIAPGISERRQAVRLQVLSGPEKGQERQVEQSDLSGTLSERPYAVGQTVVLTKSQQVDGSAAYFISDHYRYRTLLLILAGFVILALAFGRVKGLGALLGLGFSILVLTMYIVPRIVRGDNPLLVTLIGACLIVGVSLFLAHGFNRRTWVALGSTVVTLALATGLSQVLVRWANLFGQGTEEAFYLQVSSSGSINLRGLLLAGIVIGTLGVLDDITTAQTAVVGELRQANPNLSPWELYRRGLVVGREHIASLVNTLVLAYAGAALPLFILFSINRQMPLWMTLNSELVAEEFVRTVVGSSALILAVPIATLLAVHFLKREPILQPADISTKK